MGHDEDGPLRATYNHQRPPWIGLYSDRKYTKQPEWWAEPGFKDHVLRRGGFYGNKPQYHELDPRFYDPAVENGKSLSGPCGKDSKYTPNETLKGDTPGRLWDWQKDLMKNSLQYKQIAEKYDISPEHPGLAVSPNLNQLRLQPLHNLGIGTLSSSQIQMFGPRFFDKPLNEACHEKVLAVTKYIALFMVPFTMGEIRATASIPLTKFTPRAFIGRYFKLSPLPIGVGGAWALSLCTAATIRNKDDVTNHFIAGPITGAFLASVRNNVTIGVILAGIATTLGIFWQYQRFSDQGLTGYLPPQNNMGWHGGPLGWKMLMQGDAEVPKHVY